MRLLDVFNQLYKNKEIIGIDETGVGDFFTPVIGVCAFLPKNLHLWATELGIKDSKLLTDNRIQILAKELIKKIPYTKYVLTQSGYNKLVSKKYNANEIKYFIHMHCLEHFFDKYNNINVKDFAVLVDQYSTFNSILKYQKKFNEINLFNDLDKKDIDIIYQKKAESINLSVACASIIARYYLIEYMNKQRSEWNYEFAYGASSKVKQQVKEFALKHGEESLEKVCKTSFKL
ncbi:ribonuclease HIII [Mycoplasma sp. 4423]